MEKKYLIAFFNLKMKLLTGLFVLAMISTVSAKNNYAQETLFVLNLKNITVENVLSEIENQSEYHFFYNNKKVDVTKKVNINVRSKTIFKVLDQLKEQIFIEYEVIDKQIVITPKKIKESESINEDPVKTIKGIITDIETNEPIPGATVIIKDNNIIGTSSNINGEYSISVPEATVFLVYSCIGMQQQIIEINNRNEINVQLRPEQLALDEIIFVGYGRQIKSELTGSIVKVNTENLNEIPVQSVESTLQEKTAGVFIGQSSGRLGEGISIQVRGASSISASNQPLFVVDGVPIINQNLSNSSNHPTNPLSNMDLNNIETLQILKDASAAAIYGSRASNGVVIITTKKGKEGKTKFTANISKGWSQPTNKLEFLNGDQYMELLNESYDNAADESGNLWGQSKVGWFDSNASGWREANNYNWHDESFQDAQSTNMNLTASGGNEKVTYFTGISYTNQDGILVGNHYDRFNGNLNLTVNATDKISYGMSSSFTRGSLDRLPQDDAFSNPMQLVAQPTVTPIIDPATGEYNSNTLYYNALTSTIHASENTVTNHGIGNIFANIEILPGLTYRSEFGYDLLNQEERNHWGSKTNTGSPSGQALSRDVRVFNYNLNNFATYNLSFKDQSTIEFVAGMSYQESDLEYLSLTGKNLSNDYFKTVGAASEVVNYDGYGESYSYISYFGRSNIKLKEKYLISVSGRVDGSSRFGSNNKYALFPSASLGWIISRENFLEDNKIISFLKIRGSYGETGNSEIDNSASLGSYESSNYAGTAGIKPLRLESPDLKWETTTQYDIGIDFGFLNNRISGEIDYYYKHTTDLLLNRTLPAMSGYLSVIENVGELENRGFEFSLNSSNLKGKFQWNTNFNISFNKNKVININGTDIISTWPGVNRVREGEEIGVFVMRKYAGVDPQTGSAQYYVSAGSDELTTDYNAAEVQVVGSPSPDFSGGITNSLKYLNFDLSFLFSFVYGNEIYNNSGQYYSNNMDWFDNQTVDQLNRWQNPGDITNVPRAQIGSANGTGVSSRWLEDGSYLRLKNISLGYNIPKNYTSKLNISKCRVYLSIQNLFTFTNYGGWDPEVNYAGTGRSTQDNNIIQGVAYYTVPQAKTFMIGLKMEF